MNELELSVILNLVLFISLPFVGGLVATYLRLPRMIGYIISGMVLGVLMHGDTHQTLAIFGNVGLFLLLFTVGLEMNISSMQRFGKALVSIGLMQVGITWVIFTLLTAMIGLTFQESVVIGFIFALSSTAIASKVIQEKGEETSLVGGMSMGLLLLQDILVIPFMIVLSSLGQNMSLSHIVFDSFVSFAKAGIILSLIYVSAQGVVPAVLGKVATISRELLNLMTILFIFVCVAVFTMMGLSPALAAFVAGVVIGGTLEHYQIFSQMRPLRDIFTILFFVFLGASLQFEHIIPVLPKALFFAAIVMIVKGLVIAGLFVYFRFHSKTAAMVGILLAQVGEFAFIILHQAQVNNLVGEETYVFAITTTLLTIALSPIFMDRKERLYKKVRGFVRKNMPWLDTYVSYRVDREPAHIDALNIRDHVIMCGYGRVGSYIGRALTMAQIPFIAIDYNYHQVEEYRKKGVNIIYGDPTDIDILDFAQAEYATALISAVPDAFSQEMIILNAKTLNPKITIFTRVAMEKHQKRMKDLGAEVVIQPEFEAALSIVRKILIGYNVPKKDIVGKVQRLKLEHGMA